MYINVRIPANLKDFKDAVGVGLLHLANGHSVDLDDKGLTEGLEQTSIKLSDDGANYLNVLKNRGGDTQQGIITKALLWVSSQPDHVRLSKI
jgi:hypothetical protein